MSCRGRKVEEKESGSERSVGSHAKLGHMQNSANKREIFLSHCFREGITNRRGNIVA